MSNRVADAGTGTRTGIAGTTATASARLVFLRHHPAVVIVTDWRLATLFAHWYAKDREFAWT